MRQMKEMFATIYNNKHTITLNAANGESVLYSSDRLPPDGVSMDNFKPVVHMNKDGKIKPIKK